MKKSGKFLMKSKHCMPAILLMKSKHCMPAILFWETEDFLAAHGVWPGLVAAEVAEDGRRLNALLSR